MPKSEAEAPRSEAEIRATLDEVIEDVERNQRTIGLFSGNVGDLARATKSLTSVMEERFDEVNRRFEQVDRRFEQVDQRFDRLDTEIGLLQDSVRTIDARIEQLVGYIIRDEQKVDRSE